MTDLKATSYGPSAIMTPANFVTLARLLAAPIAFAMMLTDDDQSSWPLLAIWFVLSCSDFLDGRLARKHGKTRSGAFLDPLADKVLVIGGVGCMAIQGRPTWGVALAIIVVREVAVSLFRFRYARQGLAVPASQLAKWKTFIQLGAVGWVTWPWTTHLRWLADGTLWIGVTIGVVSGVQYFLAGGRAASTMS